MDTLGYYTLAVATLLIIGETLVVIKTNKYWPLSLDDYAVCGLLLYGAFTMDQNLSLLIMIGAWCFMLGNLYAMLFTRMDPNGGSRERLGALTLMLVLGLIGLVATTQRFILSLSV